MQRGRPDASHPSPPGLSAIAAKPAMRSNRRSRPSDHGSPCFNCHGVYSRQSDTRCRQLSRFRAQSAFPRPGKALHGMRAIAHSSSGRSRRRPAESSHGSSGEEIDRNPATCRHRIRALNLTNLSLVMTDPKKNRAQELFDLSGRVAIITGGAGLLGYYHAAILASAGAHAVLLDLHAANPASRAAQLTSESGVNCLGIDVDITAETSLHNARGLIVATFGRIDILINNAANNPKVEDTGGQTWSRLENFPLEVWDADIRVGLTGAFLCSRIFGTEMVKRGGGVIVNVASDLGLIAPDQ